MENYINKINQIKQSITDRKEQFKEVQKICNEITNQYQIAIFEDDEINIKRIEDFISSIDKTVQWGEQNIPFRVLYQMQTPSFNQLLCSYLYNPNLKLEPTDKVKEFVKEYMDIENNFVESVLICLIYL